MSLARSTDWTCRVSYRRRPVRAFSDHVEASARRPKPWPKVEREIREPYVTLAGQPDAGSWVRILA
jgi:hypothetical protein